MNNQYSLLIVEDNKDEQKTIKTFFENKNTFENIFVATTGEEALSIVANNKINIILLDLILNGGIDGIGILEKLHDSENSPKVIITSGIPFNNVTLQTIKLGAIYYIVKPYDLDMLYNRVLSVLDVIEEDSLMLKISSYLQLLGVSAALKGYSYIREAIYIKLKDNNSTLKDICKKISASKNTTEKSVSRAIDNSIDTAIKKCNINTYIELFGNTFNDIRCKPTANEFISTVADKIQLESNTDLLITK